MDRAKADRCALKTLMWPFFNVRTSIRRIENRVMLIRPQSSGSVFAIARNPEKSRFVGGYDFDESKFDRERRRLPDRFVVQAFVYYPRSSGVIDLENDHHTPTSWAILPKLRRQIEGKITIRISGDSPKFRQ